MRIRSGTWVVLALVAAAEWAGGCAEGAVVEPSRQSSSGGDSDSDSDGDSDGDADSDADLECGNINSSATCTENVDATCYCLGCVSDGECTLDDDCVCDDCQTDAFCSNLANCQDDGICSPYTEGCDCDDCAAHPGCG